MGDRVLRTVPEKIAELENQALFAAAVREEKAFLVKEAQGFMTLGPKPNGVGNKQFRNLIDVAMEAGSVIEVEAFVKYQIGRETGWHTRFGQDTFGAALLKAVSRIVDHAQGKRPDDEVFKVRLVTYFFGYLSWLSKYAELERGRK